MIQLRWCPSLMSGLVWSGLISLSLSLSSAATFTLTWCPWFVSNPRRYINTANLRAGISFFFCSNLLCVPEHVQLNCCFMFSLFPLLPWCSDTNSNRNKQAKVPKWEKGRCFTRLSHWNDKHPEALLASMQLDRYLKPGSHLEEKSPHLFIFSQLQ